MNRFQALQLVDRFARMEARVDEVLPEKPPHPPAIDDRAAREKEREFLDELSIDLLRDTRALAQALRTTEAPGAVEKGQGIRDPEQWIEPVVIHVDELVTRRLTAGGLMSWSLLQREHYGFSDGGERFYDRLTDLLERGVPFNELLPYLFALHKGFQGKFHESEREQIQEYVRRIRSAAPLVEVAPRETTAPRAQRRKPLSPLQLYLLAGLGFVAYSTLLVVVSNTVSG